MQTIWMEKKINRMLATKLVGASAICATVLQILATKNIIASVSRGLLRIPVATIATTIAV